MQKSLISYIRKGWVLLIFGLLVGALLAGLVTHAYFPKIVEKEKLKEVPCNSTLNPEKEQPKPSNSENKAITKPQLHYPADRPRGEPNIAYVIEHDETGQEVKIQAGSDYTNEPDRCAKLHKRNC